jgi:hypothetical protein
MGSRFKAPLILCFIWVGCVLVAPINAQEKWRTIPTEELAAQIDHGDEICLVNVLPKIIYDDRHIPGSINIPLGEIATSPLLPEDKRQPLVFYCMGTL